MEIVKKPDIRVFASGAKTGEILSFPDILRGWGVTLDQTQGKPPIEWMNDAFNRIDLNNLYLLQQGIPGWDSAIRYPVDSIIKHDGKIYLCVEENDNNEPNANSDKWSLYVRNASEKDAGILKTATQAEVNTGANDTNAVTPKKLAEKLKKLPDATLAQKGITQLASTIDDSEDKAITPKAVFNATICIGQAWQNVISTRMANTTYVNNTTKPIMIVISIISNHSLADSEVLVDGVVVASLAVTVFQGSAPSVRSSVSIIVPAGSNYFVKSKNENIMHWAELR